MQPSNDTPAAFCKTRYPLPLCIDVLDGFVTGICVIFGLCGNAYSLVILSKLKSPKGLRIYLICLALWDTMVLLSCFGYYSVKACAKLLGGDGVLSWSFWSYQELGLNGPMTTALTGSVWTTVAIAFARFLAVWKPLHSRLNRPTLRSLRVCIVVAVCAIVYCIPCYFELQLQSCWIPHPPHLTVELYSPLYTNPHYFLIYRTILYAIFVSVGPFLLIAVLSAKIMLLLRGGGDDWPLRYSDARNRRKTGLLLSILLGKFLACHLMPTALMLMMSSGQRMFIVVYKYHLTHISNFFVILNSATNFLVYAQWRAHKEEVRRKLTRRKGSSRQENVEFRHIHQREATSEF